MKKLFDKLRINVGRVGRVRRADDGRRRRESGRWIAEDRGRKRISNIQQGTRNDEFVDGGEEQSTSNFER